MSIVTNLTYRAMLLPMRRQARRFAHDALCLERTQRELLERMLVVLIHLKLKKALKKSPQHWKAMAMY